MAIKTISLPEDQAKWIRENDINLSWLIQDTIKSKQQERGAQMRKEQQAQA
jgi:hypothetical protein